jgi:hypothetical protein
MKITIESTSKIVKANGVDCRVWEGETASGIKISALIPRIAVAPDQDVSQFEAELRATRPPSPEVEAWPLRMIL